MPAKNGGGDAQSLIQVTFPSQATVVFFTAIGIGIALIGVSTLLRAHFALNGPQSNLVLCIGAALVLAAFGGQATVRVGRVIMAGVAAVAIGLFIYLQQTSASLFIKGTVHNFDYGKYESLDMNQRHRVLGRIVANDKALQWSSYDFVLFKEEMDGEFIEVTLTNLDTKREQRLRVPAKEVEWAFGGRRLEWELHEAEEKGETVLSLVERFRKKTIAQEKVVGELSDAEPRSGWALIAPVLARGLPEQIDVELMLKRLKSADTAMRRDARDALSRAPIESLPRMMRAFREQSSDYRVKLGICAALAQMLRAHKNRAPAVSKLLTDDDVTGLVDAAGDRDRTVRVYAAEFLFDLADPRATSLAIGRAAETSDENARFNWLLVAQAAWLKLTPQQKRALAGELTRAEQQSGPRTKVLFDKLKS